MYERRLWQWTGIRRKCCCKWKWRLQSAHLTFIRELHFSEKKSDDINSMNRNWINTIWMRKCWTMWRIIVLWCCRNRKTTGRMVVRRLEYENLRTIICSISSPNCVKRFTAVSNTIRTLLLSARWWRISLIFSFWWNRCRRHSKCATSTSPSSKPTPHYFSTSTWAVTLFCRVWICIRCAILAKHSNSRAQELVPRCFDVRGICAAVDSVVTCRLFWRILWSRWSWPVANFSF